MCDCTEEYARYYRNHAGVDFPEVWSLACLDVKYMAKPDWLGVYCIWNCDEMKNGLPIFPYTWEVQWNIIVISYKMPRMTAVLAEEETHNLENMAE